jgi:hypothetical protein
VHWVGKHRRAALDEKLRHLIVVAILPDRGVWRRAESVGQERDMLLLDEAADLFDRFRRAIGVVEADEMILRPLIPP